MLRFFAKTSGIIALVAAQGDVDIDFDHTDIADAEHELLFGFSGDSKDYSDIQADIKPLFGDEKDTIVLNQPDTDQSKFDWLDGFEARSGPGQTQNLQFDFTKIERTPEEMALLARRKRKRIPKRPVKKPSVNLGLKYPKFGATADFEWKTGYGHYIITAQYAARRSDNIYPPPATCRPIQGHQKEILLTFRDARSFIYGAKTVWGLNTMAGIRSVNDNDMNGGRCSPRPGDPVMSVGDSGDNIGAKKNRRADFWVSDRVFDFEPSYTYTTGGIKVIPGDCNILTQSTGVLFWICDSARHVEVENGVLDLVNIVANSQIKPEDKYLEHIDLNPAKTIANVGCWCGKLDSSKTALMGNTLDYPIDQLCKLWWNCKKCSSFSDSKNCHDHDGLGDELADEESVSSPSGYSVIEDEGIWTCSDENESCAQSRCKCDLQFAERVANFLESVQAGDDCGEDDATCEAHAIREEFTDLIERGEVGQCDKAGMRAVSKDRAIAIEEVNGDVQEVLLPAVDFETPVRFLADACCGNPFTSEHWQLYSTVTNCCDLESGKVTSKFGNVCV